MRTIRWLTVAAVAWLIVVHGVPLPRWVRAELVQYQFPPECRIERIVVPNAAGQTGEVRVDLPDTCPNASYRVRAIARDAAGNTRESDPSFVTNIRLARDPALRLYGTKRLFPTAGYLELAVSDTKRRQFGLSPDGQRFRWSVAVQHGTARVIEDSQVRATVPAPAGTLLRLAVSQGQVRYERNGVEFYASLARLTGPAWVELTLEDAATPPGYLTIAGGS